MVKSLISHKTLKEVKELQLWKFKNVGAKYGPNHIKSFDLANTPTKRLLAKKRESGHM